MRLDSSNPHQKMKVVPYRASKAALNMVTACQAYEYGERGWVVVAFCPGFTASGLSVSIPFLFTLSASLRGWVCVDSLLQVMMI